MQVLTKSQAERLSTESLFKSGGTFTTRDKVKYCTGKYNTTVYGRELPHVKPEAYHAIWGETRRDREGVYVRLYCAPKSVTVTATN